MPHGDLQPWKEGLREGAEAAKEGVGAEAIFNLVNTEDRQYGLIA